MKAPRTCYLYAGPTLQGLESRSIEIPGDVCLRPPVRRGDIATLISSEPPAVLAVVDGYFYQDLAIGHQELREALACGWEVWGLSSLGAIRAIEMAALGMRGSGRVYGRFVENPEMPDDAVALLHGPAPRYNPLTEPLVHLAEAVGALAEGGWISQAAAASILRDLESVWFGDRTLLRFRMLVEQAVQQTSQERRAACQIPREEKGDTMASVAALLANFDRFRIKSWDLLEFLEAAPWRDTGGGTKEIGAVASTIKR